MMSDMNIREVGIHRFGGPDVLQSGAMTAVERGGSLGKIVLGVQSV